MIVTRPVLACLLVCAAAACRPAAPPERFTEKLVILGFDGLDPRRPAPPASLATVVGYAWWRRAARRIGGRAVLLASLSVAAAAPALVVATRSLELVTLVTIVGAFFGSGADLALFDELGEPVPLQLPQVVVHLLPRQGEVASDARGGVRLGQTFQDPEPDRVESAGGLLGVAQELNGGSHRTPFHHRQ